MKRFNDFMLIFPIVIMVLLVIKGTLLLITEIIVVLAAKTDEVNRAPEMALIYLGLAAIIATKYYDKKSK